MVRTRTVYLPCPSVTIQTHPCHCKRAVLPSVVRPSGHSWFSNLTEGTRRGFIEQTGLHVHVTTP